MSINDDAKQLRELKHERDDAKDKAQALERQYKEAESRFMEELEQAGIDSIKVEGMAYVPAETVYGQVQDRSVFLDWAHEHQPELLEERERKQLINELVRKHLDDGEPLPPGLGFYVREYVSLRAS